MKRGFTLVELLGVITVLGLITLIVFPNVTKSINNSKQKLYHEQVSVIERNAKRWAIDHTEQLSEYSSTFLPLSDLVTGGYLKKGEIIDPRNDSEMDGCIVIQYSSSMNQYEYEYTEQNCIEIVLPTPEECFVFEPSTGSIVGYHLNGVQAAPYYDIEGDIVHETPTENVSCPSDIVFPSRIDGVEVKRIGDYAFTDTDWDDFVGSIVGGIGITSVNFELLKNISSIGKYAFFSNDLKNVTIPSSVTEIESWAFSYNQLASIEIPEGVEKIDHWVFIGNQLTDVIIPNSVITVGESAFSENNLESVTIGNGVTSLGAYAFYSNQLTSVEIPDRVTYIGGNAFSENPLTEVSIPDTVEQIDTEAFPASVLTEYQNGDFIVVNHNLLYYTGSATEVIIPSDVIYIRSSVFSEKGLTSVTLGSNVKTIDSFAFYGNQLTSVIIPNSVIEIGHNSFAENQLTSITLGDSVESIGDGAFEDNQLTSVVIPDSVTSIGYAAFYFNQLTSVTIKGKSSSSEFENYGGELTFGWAKGYSDSNITWNG